MCIHVSTDDEHFMEVSDKEGCLIFEGAIVRIITSFGATVLRNTYFAEVTINHSVIQWILSKLHRGCHRSVMVKPIDCGIVLGEFVLKLRYNVHFRANTLGKCMDPFILPAMG